MIGGSFGVEKTMTTRHTLDEEDIKAAIVDWLECQHNHTCEAKDVIISVANAGEKHTICASVQYEAEE